MWTLVQEYYECFDFEDISDLSEVHTIVQVRTLGKTPS